MSVMADSELSPEKGYFGYGKDVVCFGRLSAQSPASGPSANLHDVSKNVRTVDGKLLLPFDVDEVLHDLEHEVYAENAKQVGLADPSLVVSAYYWLRPLLPLHARKHFQRVRLRHWKSLAFPHWPVDCTVDRLCEELLLANLKAQCIDKIPFIWFWPKEHSSAAMMTHDVETELGRDYSDQLMDIDDSFGIKASFQVVPECRYEVPRSYINSIWDRGFEVAVHDLNHDGRLFQNYQTFQERVAKINAYRKEFRASGFRAAVLYRRQLWNDALDFAYDMSVPSVAHLDPQRGGCCTVKPYFTGKMIELPVTTTQDYTLFHILNDRSIDLWKRQTELIMERHGLISFIIHPDYVIQQKERAVYQNLLAYLDGLRSKQNVWIALPCEIENWWRQRAAMRINEENGDLRIEGAGSERATIAYASEEDGHLAYSFAPNGIGNAPRPSVSAKP
jgi:hypothetical protein